MRGPHDPELVKAWQDSGLLEFDADILEQEALKRNPLARLAGKTSLANVIILSELLSTCGVKNVRSINWCSCCAAGTIVIETSSHGYRSRLRSRGWRPWRCLTVPEYRYVVVPGYYALIECKHG